MKVNKLLYACIFIFVLPWCASSQSHPEQQYYITVFQGLNIFRASYPDVKFDPVFDYDKGDYKVTVTAQGMPSCDFYWCGGAMIPEEELINKDKYWSLLYQYQEELIDPADFTQEQKEALSNFSSTDTRRNGAGTPMFFFDYLYSSSSMASVERHIKSIYFLGNPTRVHERIVSPLKKVEERIYRLAETDSKVRDFVDKIKSNDAYYWRLIDGTNRKSFHSLGIAIDIIPVRITGEIFWSWTRDKNPSGWMFTPLSRRWLVPSSIVKIFEEEGFIWGGKWAIWDNMHFEYHPELINYNFHKEIMYRRFKVDEE